MGVDFKAKQQEFSAYIRDPEHQPLPADVKKQRMHMYRELFFNNIEGFLADNFPVLKKILADSSWQTLVQDFFCNHVSKTPYFSEIAEEFLDFLENERNESQDFPFMLELAHYEWVEMALSIAKDEALVSEQNSDNLLSKNIRLSPLAWPFAYQYPVQRIGPGFLPETAPERPTCLIVYRDFLYNVNFIEITPVTYRLLELLQGYQEKGGVSAQACLLQLTSELPQADSEMIITNGLQILKELADKSIIQIIA